MRGRSSRLGITLALVRETSTNLCLKEHPELACLEVAVLVEADTILRVH